MTEEENATARATPCSPSPTAANAPMSEIEAVAALACPCSWAEETRAVKNVKTYEAGWLDVNTPGVVHIATPTVLEGEGGEKAIVNVRTHGKKYGNALDLVQDGWRPL